MPVIKPEASERPEPVSLWEAFGYWLKLGFISFGGPAGQISMMHQELDVPFPYIVLMAGIIGYL